MSIANNLLTGVRVVESPNCDDRPDEEISLIVVHCISLPEGHYGNPYVEQLFCNCLDVARHPDFGDLRDVRVSSHLLIGRDGQICQFVPFDRRAWHAGESSFEGRGNCNDFSIGIELEGTDHDAYRDVQYDRLIAICRALVEEFGIAPRNIVGHSDIAPGRKTDPGPRFDWDRVRRAIGPA